MLFTEPAFLFVFLPLVLALYFVPPRAAYGRGANALLVVASVLFYASGGGAFTALVLASIAFNYRMAIEVDRRRGTPGGRAALAFAVGIDLVVLGVFKYANFFVDNVNALLAAAGAPPLAAPHVVLPIGISFFTFHAISYVVDVHRRHAAAQKSPLDAALYLLLFPQLIAGPIIRYRDIAAQLARRTVGLDDFAEGVRRFVVGLAKKLLVANVVAVPADAIFGMPAAERTAAHAWLGIACYTLQIYFDFSGYSDMAVGLGRMFGFRFPENFRWPYSAASVQDFWRRWHVSLSTWFRDYLYLPLGGSRTTPLRTYRNLVLVFFLCGLWHGASWSFVVWGLFHGAFLVAERLGLGDAVERAPRPLRHAYVLLVVAVGWVFFRADDLSAALAYLSAMAGLAGTAPTAFSPGWYLTPAVAVAMAAGAIGSAPVAPALAAGLERRAGRPALAWGAALARAAAVLLLLAASGLQVSARTYDPFIYFRF